MHQNGSRLDQRDIHRKYGREMMRPAIRALPPRGTTTRKKYSFALLTLFWFTAVAVSGQIMASVPR